MAQFYQDTMNQSVHVEITASDVIDLASKAAVDKLVAEAVYKTICEDDDIRILLREYVRDAISKMNLQDVVTSAVSHALLESQALKTDSK